MQAWARKHRMWIKMVIIVGAVYIALMILRALTPAAAQVSNCEMITIGACPQQ